MRVPPAQEVLSHPRRTVVCMKGLAGLRTELHSIVSTQLEALDEFLIVEAPPYYVQALFTRIGVYAEVVGNSYLPASSRRPRTIDVALIAAGWNEPGSPCREWCKSRHRNFHRVWLLETPATTIVDTLLQALVIACLSFEGQALKLTRHPRVEEGVH